MKRPPGRPPRAATPVAPDEVLTAALDLLDCKGAEAFTMRALAQRLQVTPMTVHHHFGGRDGLIAAMSDMAYANVTAPDSGTPTERIRCLLRGYHAQVVRHPDLTMLIFSRPAAYSRQARRITEEITALLEEMGLPDHKARLWIDILIDFTHGAALATAMTGRATAAEPGKPSGYEAALDELLTKLGE